MSKLLITLCFVALFLFVSAEKESKKEDEEKTKSENQKEAYDNDDKESEESDSKYMKQNMEAPVGYIPLYYEYVPFYEFFGYEV